MRFELTENGFIPSEMINYFQASWDAPFHDFSSHFYEGYYPFDGKLTANLIGELASMGAEHYLDIRLFGRMGKAHRILFNAIETIFIILTKEHSKMSYENNYEDFLERIPIIENEKVIKHFKLMCEIAWDKLLKYGKDFTIKNPEYKRVLHNSFCWGYFLCEVKFKNVSAKSIYKFDDTLNRLAKHDALEFSNKYSAAEFIIKKNKIIINWIKK